MDAPGPELAAAAADRGREDLPRSIGFRGAIGVMVGVMIGGGIFSAPPEIARALDSPWVILVLWGVGGVLSLCGALTFAELAAMHPRTGGVYVFLREGYGRGVAFIFGWTYLLLSKPFAAGGIAVVFAQHLNTLLGVTWDHRVVMTVVLVSLTALNTLGLRVGSGVAGFLTALKVAALGAVVVLGVRLVVGGGGGGAGEVAAGGAAAPAGITLGALAVAMSMVLWTYDGWADVGAIAGEVREPGRNLPRAYVAGTMGVMGLYIAVNAVYMAVVPLAEMRGLGRGETVAPLVVGRLLEGLGAAAAAGGAAVTLAVIVSTLGSTHGSIITGARVSFAQARDGLLFRFLGRVQPRFGTPAASLWCQLGLSLAALWYAAGFKELAETFVFTMWIFYGLAGGAVFILRVRRPGAERPFRCPGYPVVPAVFIAASAAMTVMMLIESPRQNLVWVAVLLAGAPAYWVWTRVAPARADGEGAGGLSSGSGRP